MDVTPRAPADGFHRLGPRSDLGCDRFLETRSAPTPIHATPDHSTTASRILCEMNVVAERSVVVTLDVSESPHHQRGADAQCVVAGRHGGMIGTQAACLHIASRNAILSASMRISRENARAHAPWCVCIQIEQARGYAACVDHDRIEAHLNGRCDKGVDARECRYRVASKDHYRIARGRNDARTSQNHRVPHSISGGNDIRMFRGSSPLTLEL